MAQTYNVFHLDMDFVEALKCKDIADEIIPEERDAAVDAFKTITDKFDRTDTDRVGKVLRAAHKLFQLGCYDHVAVVETTSVNKAIRLTTVSESQYEDWWTANRTKVKWISDDVRRSTGAFDIVLSSANEAYLVHQFVNWSFNKAAVAIIDDFVSDLLPEVETGIPVKIRKKK